MYEARFKRWFNKPRGCTGTMKGGDGRYRVKLNTVQSWVEIWFHSGQKKNLIHLIKTSTKSPIHTKTQPNDYQNFEKELVIRLQSFVGLTPHFCLLAVDDNRWSSQQGLQLKSNSTWLLVIAFLVPRCGCVSECVCVQVCVRVCKAKFHTFVRVIGHLTSFHPFNLDCLSDL